MDKFMAWFKLYFWEVVTKQYVNFEGRASRPQYWYFVLVCFIISLILSILHLGVINFIISLALFIPSIAICARRLHDINQSGWLQLIVLIPILGWIAIIILCVLPPVEPNKYGNNSKVKETTASTETDKMKTETN
ncbi:MAG: DUF805 domain-containing protein [Endomicrobia bacterium]|nr:DUF805 domain-containing protein [Endomicrobiia bacterium]MCL2799070.1 DUF805 domain-containing protein [Endomicrobiia bacterium]